VLKSGGAVLSGALLAPNPVPWGAANVQVRWKPLAGIKVTARRYNLAGELVLTAVNGSSPDRLSLDLGGRPPLASGIYLVNLTAQSPSGGVERRTLKLVMVH
jgi:hypothetical protein